MTARPPSPSTTSTTFVIRLHTGDYVTGYNEQHMIVQFGALTRAKQFFTKSRAELWAAKYADAGFGLQTGGFAIVGA